jgi:hypothetical protein
MRPLHVRSAVPSLLAVLAVLSVAACGTASVDGAAGSSRPTTAPSATPATSTTSGPVGPLGGRGRLVTVTGTVSAGVEKGCLLFAPEADQPGGAWVLLGHTDGLEAGQRVTLRGALIDSTTTTCQQGSPFRVEQVLEVTDR